MAIQTEIGRASPPENTNPHKRIAAYEVRELCGGISDMTLWRWMQNSNLNFPAPIYIGRRRFWREAEVIAWLDAQGSEGAA